MATTTKETGSMIRLKEMGLMNISKARNMLETGKMINSMDLEWRIGLMGQILKAPFRKGRNMATVCLNGLTVPPTSALSK